MFYYFLGNTPALSVLELQTVTNSPVNLISPHIASGPAILSDLALIQKLGGLRKAAVLLKQGAKIELKQLLKDALATISNKNIAITDYASTNLGKTDLYSLKTTLNRPVRFVSMETTEHELVMLAHQHVAELNILPVPTDPDSVAVALTNWIFDAEDWIKRDRNKPYRDIKRGMLPPKVARIMTNLALKGTEGRSLYDPFCGTGTVLAEAALIGVTQLFGSDTNPTAVDGAQKNLDWIRSTYNLSSTNYQFSVADATHPPFNSVDTIATEPYMGPLLDGRNPLPLAKIKDIARGLDKLYRGAFKSWHKILPLGGRVVMTIPSFAVYGRVIPTISVDTLTSLGYNYISSVPYGKPGATVIRNITIFEKT